MSEHHYSHIPPPVYGHLGNDQNKQRSDFSGLSSSANQLWSAGPPNEFGNRKEYMETQLTEENYNSCDLDSNANQNDVIDDEPYPPPGLRRLVTGQTVSFDDGPGSPPFDRVVPGEGNAFSNYPQPARMSKPAADPYPENIAISERYVSGSTTKDYSSLPHQPFVAQPPKKDTLNAYNNSAFAGVQPPKKDTINMSSNDISTQDFFDSYLQDSNSAHDESTSKPNQCSKKFPNLPGGFHNNEASKRGNYFQPEKPVNAPKPLQNNFNDDFNNENLNSPFPMNLQTRANHLQPDGKVLKPLDHSQSTNLEKPLDAYLSVRRPSVENFTQEHPSAVTGYGIPYNQQVNSQNYNASFQTYESNPLEENNAHFNHTEQSAIRGNQEDGFGNRDVAKKDSAHHDGNFSDHRELANVTLEASLIVDVNKESNLKSPYRKNSIVGGEDRADYDGVSLERGKVPGAQSTPNDSQNQSMRSFQNSNNSNYNNSNIFKTIEDDGEREEIVQGTDSDEKSLGRRMVLGYNSNTIPGPRSGSRKMLPDSKVNTQYQFDSSFSKSNKIEPLEHRMVVGEGGNIPSKSKNPSGPRYSRDRKKQLYDRIEHHNVDSDDEDYEEFGDRTYDNSPDRESRSYHDKYYRNSPPHRSDKRSYRRTRDSFTQSQDESYFDDDDDDDYTYRNQRKYYGRRYPREPVYKHYEHDPRYRDERRYPREPLYKHYEHDPRYRDERNSRPSSRSGSEYRREFVDYVNPRFYNRLPYYEHLDHRYIVNYGGEPRLSKKETDYWSKIREIDPQKYMNWFKVTFVQEYKEWYLKYVSAKMVQPGNTYQADRRGSGHSGQSSVNNDITANDDGSLDISREQSLFKPVESDLNLTQEIRCTPMKFSIPHAKGKFSSLNQLLMINPCSPRDGQRANIDFGRVLSVEQDVDYIEFLKFSGPCIVGETHVNTVSNYLRNLINNASDPSEQLLYQLIDLIIKLRGVTDEVAISELLTDNYRKSQIANVMPSEEEMKLAANNHQSLSETELIEKFYNLYFQGNRNEALDLALSNQMWGQAMIAGFTMGPKYHSRVLNEFFNIPINSPLKTAYQFYSKQIPQVAMICSDEKWNDWRIHLAVMLSYPTPDPEFNKQAIITLGDSLSHKDIFASHFCYLAAQADFGPPTKQSTKYTLLTLRNCADNFDNYPPTRAILLTEIYEFAKRLQRKKFTIGSLLPYKLLLAVRLISHRNFSVALQYLESMALDIIENPNDYDQSQINDVVELSEKVKYSDGKFLNASDLCDEKQWLIDLRRIANLDYNERFSGVPQLNEHSSYPEDQSFSHHQLQQQQQPHQQQHTAGQQPSCNQPQSFTPNEVQQPVFFNPSLPINPPMSLPPSFPPVSKQPSERRPSQPWESEFHSHELINYAVPDPYKSVASNNNEYFEPNDSNTQLNNQFDQSDALTNEQQSYWDTSPQTVTMHSKSKFPYFPEEDKKPISNKKLNNLTQDASQNIRENNQPTNKNIDKNTKKENKNENSKNGGGWLEGIFGKLSLRAKTEMKLPDDKNPSIVWNEEKKKWVDVNGDDEDDISKIPPPPRASGVPNVQPQLAPNQLPRSNGAPSMSQLHADPNKPPVQSSGTNMYKLPRGKSMKMNYVNVLSQSTTPSNNVPPPGPAMDGYSQMPSNMNFFAPSSDGVSNHVSGDPGSNSKLPENPQIRNSNPEMPMFYNPAQYTSNS
ncbi:protein transport protein Sec16A isoform X2 [Planococcus citri]|uniref:protein transport protein Sec16A isoform X2 n=1 Tax=Planococcus citri TaxID=170843 RepID=UPI0031F8BDFA